MASNQAASAAQTNRDPAVMQTERDAGKVLLLGGLAAGAVAGLIVLLTDRKDEPESKLEQARHVVDEAAGSARKRGKKVEGDLASTIAAFRGDSKKQGKKARKDARKRGKKFRKESGKRAEIAAAGLSELFSQARDDVRKRYESAEKQAPDLDTVMDEVRARTEELMKDARESGQQIRKQSAIDTRKAKKDMMSLLDVVKTKASDAEKVAESYVESTLLPKLKEFEKEASTAFETGKKKSAEKSAEFREQAEKELIPQARESAEKIRATVEDQAKSVVENWDTSPQDATERLQEVREAAGAQAKEASEAVKQGGRETRSLLVWVGLGAALIYWVFLNEEQQQKVKDLSTDLIGEAREMYSDLKGDGDAISA